MSAYYSTASQAIADYRERATTMTSPSSQRYYCAVCKLSRQIVGRKKIAGGHVCEICQKAWKV